MSPTIFAPGVSAVKSRFTRSGIGPAWPWRGGGPPRPRLAGHQAQLPHQGADQLQPGAHAPAGQLGVHAPVPVGAIGIIECLPDYELQLFPAFRRCAFRPRPPFIIA